MPIEPIKIPQNVYIEDRIVGPLTLKQVIISAIGCGFSYALFTSFSKAMGGTPPLPVTVLIWVPGAVSLLFAFVKINDLSLLHILLLMLEKANKPAVRAWAPRRGITVHFRTSAPAEQQETPAPAAHPSPRLEELSSLLDRAYAPADRPLPAAAPEEDDPLERTLPPPRPVDPARITASPLRSDAALDIAPPEEPRPPAHGTVSIFRDLSPRPSS